MGQGHAMSSGHLGGWPTTNAAESHQQQQLGGEMGSIHTHDNPSRPETERPGKHKKTVQSLAMTKELLLGRWHASLLRILPNSNKEQGEGRYNTRPYFSPLPDHTEERAAAGEVEEQCKRKHFLGPNTPAFFLSLARVAKRMGCVIVLVLCY